MARSQKTREFIVKARLIHGKLYSYAKTRYVDSREKLTVTHKEFGDFKVSPNRHLAGVGHPKQGVINSGKKRGLNKIANRRRRRDVLETERARAKDKDAIPLGPTYAELALINELFEFHITRYPSDPRNEAIGKLYDRIKYRMSKYITKLVDEAIAIEDEILGPL